MQATSGNVERLAKAKEDENWEFRAFLKQVDMESEELDELVFQTTRRVWERIDCATCRNCCKHYQAGFTNEEAARAAERMGASVEEFRSRYLERAEGGHDEPAWRIREQPCPFLKDNECALGDDRPAECRDFPYLYKPEFVHRLIGMVERTFTCPVVYEVMEELKGELRWRRKRSRRR